MTETLKNFERCCRLCAEEQEVTLMLFSAEASDMLLLEKLRKYLLIEIEENDKLSKNICIECCSKLRSLCEFIELVRKAQDNLLALSLKIEQLNSSIPTINAIKQEKTEITEICVDPMDILNASEETCPQQSLSYSDDIVTLKLIKQNDQNGTEEKKKYECDVCGKSFIVEQSLKNHSWIHIQDQDYSCFTCQRSFKFQKDLDKHIKSHLKTGLRYNCDLCGRRFKTNYTYDVHMQIHTKSAKAYTCNICNRSYANWTGLKIHNITHSSEKPFQCSVCDKKFKRNQELKFHMNHHTGDKPYKCKYCDKSFASTGNLYSHRNRAHALGKLLKCHETKTIPLPKINKHECPICKKNCGRQENYVYHIYQHTGEKPYSCTQCGITFLTQRNLKSHYDNVHPNVIRPIIHLPIFCPIRSKWL